MEFTENAAKEIKKIMERDGLDPTTMAVRMGVKGGDAQGSPTLWTLIIINVSLICFMSLMVLVFS